MPEDTIASQGGAAETIPAGNVSIQPATPPEASSAELIPEADSGFTADDFKHPQYGGKAKQLYRGWQKRMEEAKGFKKKADDYEALIRYSPEVNKAVKTWLRTQQGLPPEEATPAEEPSGKTEISPADQVEAKLAFHSIYASLGQGDPIKGEEIFDREYHPEIEKFLQATNGKDPKRTLRVAMEYIALKKGNTAKPQAPVVVAPETASGGERGGGTEQSAPEKPPANAWEAVEQEARRQGYSSATAMFNAINAE